MSVLSFLRSVFHSFVRSLVRLRSTCFACGCETECRRMDSQTDGWTGKRAALRPTGTRSAKWSGRCLSIARPVGLARSAPLSKINFSPLLVGRGTVVRRSTSRTAGWPPRSASTSPEKKSVAGFTTCALPTLDKRVTGRRQRQPSDQPASKRAGRQAGNQPTSQTENR